jgi:hypothetical protein
MKKIATFNPTPTQEVHVYAEKGKVVVYSRTKTTITDPAILDSLRNALVSTGTAGFNAALIVVLRDQSPSVTKPTKTTKATKATKAKPTKATK